MSQSPLSLVLWTTDIAALAEFLEYVTGAEERERHPGFAELQVGPVEISLHADEAGRGHPWYDALAREGVARGIGTEVRVHVSDVLLAWENAETLGGIAVQAPFDAGGIRECQVIGPDGYLFSLWQPAPIGEEPLAPPPPPRRDPFGSRPSARRR